MEKIFKCGGSMEQIIKVSAAEYAELLRNGECFDSAEDTLYSINYEVNGKQITGGFERKLSAFVQAQTVARMLDIPVTVKRGDMIVLIFHGRDC